MKLEIACGACGWKNRIDSARLVLQRARCGNCKASLEDEADRQSLERGFERVMLELERFRSRIYQVDGFWVFRFHRYSIEELLQSPHPRQVISITEKIGSDLDCWEREGRLGALSRATYSEKRRDVVAKLDLLLDELVQRKPTKWEVMRTLLNHLVKIVLGNLPDFSTKELPLPRSRGLLGRGED